MSLSKDSHDLQLYYGNSFIQVKCQEEWEWVYVKDIWYSLHDRQWGMLVTKNKHKKNSDGQVIQLFEEQINTKFPGTRYFFSGKEAYYLRKVAAREASRAMTLVNSAFINPLWRIFPEELMINIKPLDKFFWLSMLNNKQFNGIPLEKAQQFLLRSSNGLHPTVSLPVKEHWCLSLSPNSLFQFMLWYKLSTAGFIDKKGKYIPEGMEFNQEVADSFPELMNEHI